jgi:hypothetical protein
MKTFNKNKVINEQENAIISKFVKVFNLGAYIHTKSKSYPKSWHV